MGKLNRMALSLCDRDSVSVIAVLPLPARTNRLEAVLYIVVELCTYLPFFSACQREGIYRLNSVADGCGCKIVKPDPSARLCAKILCKSTQLSKNCHSHDRIEASGGLLMDRNWANWYPTSPFRGVTPHIHFETLVPRSNTVPVWFWVQLGLVDMHGIELN